MMEILNVSTLVANIRLRASSESAAKVVWRKSEKGLDQVERDGEVQEF